MRQFLTALTLAGLALPLFAAGNEHFQGTWKLDPGKSTQLPGEEVKALSITFKGDHVTVIGETSKGEPINTSFEAPADNKEYPVTNAPYDHIFVKQVDADHQLVTFKKDGKIQSVSNVEIKGKRYDRQGCRNGS